jgi:putative tricarboxylic transport membrane protein
MTTQTIDRIVAGSLLVFGIYIVWNAVDYGYMRGATPGPGFFPFWVGTAMAGLSCVNLVRSLRGAEILDSRFDSAGIYKALAIVAIVAVFILLTPWLGMLLASGLLVPAISFAIRPRWTPRFAVTIVAIGVGFPILCHLLFSVYLQVPLVQGVLGV